MAPQNDDVAAVRDLNRGKSRVELAKALLDEVAFRMAAMPPEPRAKTAIELLAHALYELVNELEERV